MDASKLLSLEIFKLDNNESLILYSDFLVLNLKLSQQEKVIEIISNENGIENLERNIDDKNNVAAIKMGSIVGIYTDVKHDDTLLLGFKHFRTGELISKKISFKNIEEKDKFINKTFSYIENDFSYEKRKNTLLGSIRIPFRYLVEILVFGGFLSWLAYYMETAEEYSFRIPAILYPLFLIMKRIGYRPVIALTGILSLIMIGWVMKNMIVPTEKLIIERKT